MRRPRRLEDREAAVEYSNQVGKCFELFTFVFLFFATFRHADLLTVT